MNYETTQREEEDDRKPEDRPGDGAEGGSQSSDADKAPGAPSDGDSALGDTDQHSES